MIPFLTDFYWSLLFSDRSAYLFCSVPFFVSNCELLVDQLNTKQKNSLDDLTKFDSLDLVL